MTSSISRCESDFLGTRSASLGVLDPDRAGFIATARDDLIAWQSHEQFVADVLQGGADTSTNMNANEVIASRATIADTAHAHALGVMSTDDVQALLVPEKLTRPMRLE